MRGTAAEPTLEESVERYHLTVRAIRKKARLSDSFTHYDHVTGQLLSVLTKASELYRRGCSDEKLKKTYRFNEGLLFSYLKLLGISNEFQFLEFNSVEGYFGDDECKVPVTVYVEKACKEFELKQILDEKYALV